MVVVVVLAVTTDFFVPSACVVLFQAGVVEVKGEVVIVLVDLVNLVVVVSVVLDVIVVRFVDINKSALVVETFVLVVCSKLLLNPNADMKTTKYFKPFGIVSDQLMDWSGV